MNNKIFVTSPERMPLGEHWAIIEFSSVHVPGDLRSQQAPGHGYPAHDEPTVEYMAFLKREDFEAEIQSRAGKPFQKAFRAIHVSGAFRTTPTFQVEEHR